MSGPATIKELNNSVIMTDKAERRPNMATDESNGIFWESEV
jgi:hypothetical protein